MSNVIDAVIILALLLGAALGFKKGVIKSVVSLVGTIIVLVLSFTLKNPLSVILYTYLPFFNVGIKVLNILIYEAIAFLIVFSLLSIVLKVVIKVSGIIETILKFTIVLGIPSKILGAIFGVLEMYVFTFIVLFLFVQFNIQSDLIKESKLADMILNRTPVISEKLEDTYKAIEEVITLNKNYSSSQDREKLNEDGLNIMLKYKIISTQNADKLIEKKKLKMEHAASVVDLYRKEQRLKND